MSIFQRKHYVSEASQFLDQLKTQNPQLEAEQRQGRALLWEQSVDADWNGETNTGRVQQKPYVYQNEPALR